MCSTCGESKIGFFKRVVASWFSSGSTVEAVDRRTERGATVVELLDTAVIDRLIREQRAGDATHAQPLLSILILEISLSSNPPRTRATEAGRAAA